MGLLVAGLAQLRRHWSENRIVDVIAATGFLIRWNAAMVTPSEDAPISPSALAPNHVNAAIEGRRRRAGLELRSDTIHRL